jgi:hypothetical protein
MARDLRYWAARHTPGEAFQSLRQVRTCRGTTWLRALPVSCHYTQPARRRPPHTPITAASLPWTRQIGQSGDVISEGQPRPCGLAACGVPEDRHCGIHAAW